MRDWLIRSTIWGALIFYLIALLMQLLGPRSGYLELAVTLHALERWSWRIGCGLMWVHALVAFHFFHHWSHRVAVEDTARQTQDILGFPFGRGIWFSYGLLVIWLVDAISWNSPRWYTHFYLFFILFHGAVVFKQGKIRRLGLLATGLLGIVWCWQSIWNILSQ